MDQKNRLHPHERKLKKIPPSVFCCPLPISKNTRAEVDYSGGQRWTALLTVRRRKVHEAVAVVYVVVAAASASEFHRQEAARGNGTSVRFYFSGEDGGAGER